MAKRVKYCVVLIYRKSQQKRTVCHVTAANLSADVWAWRKYGQKPIKGSPYPRLNSCVNFFSLIFFSFPIFFKEFLCFSCKKKIKSVSNSRVIFSKHRNYYRCSSSKGCSARKQVERSNVDANMFIVTYTGEHTHPRPTHRNSLAGSTRNKCSVPNKSIDKDNSASQSTANINGSCSSPQSATSLSPTTPLTVQTDEEAIIANKNSNEEENKIMIDGNDKESEEMADDDDDDDEDDDEILIPNMAMSQDIFMGLQELGYSSPGGGSGDNFSDGGGANSGSSWPPCCSAAAIATTGAAVNGC